MNAKKIISKKIFTDNSIIQRKVCLFFCFGVTINSKHQE